MALKNIKRRVGWIAFSTLCFAAVTGSLVGTEYGTGQASDADSAGAPDLSQYACRAPQPEGSTRTLHIGQYIQGSYYEWQQVHEQDWRGGRLLCIELIKPDTRQLDVDEARKFLSDSAQVGRSVAKTSTIEMRSALSGFDQDVLQSQVERIDVIPEPLPGVLPAPAESLRREGASDFQSAPGVAKKTLVPKSIPAPGSTTEGRDQPLQIPELRRNSLQREIEKPSIIGVDDRVRVTLEESEEFPFNTMGFLVTTFPNGQSFRCSGVITSPYVFVTAGHCIHNNDRGGFADEATVYAGQNQLDFNSEVEEPYGPNIGVIQLNTTQVWTQISGPSTRPTEEYRYDLAALHLATPFWHTDTFMPVVYNDTSLFVDNAGYPATVQGQGINEGLWQVSGQETQNSVDIHRENHIRTFTIDASSGQSGSPYWTSLSATSQRLLTGILSFGDDEGTDDFSGGPWYDDWNQDIVSGWLDYAPPGDPTYNFSLSVDGQGTVFGGRGRIICGTSGSQCSADYLNGDIVLYLALAEDGWEFDRWEGACGGTVPLCFTAMTATRAAQAIFVEDNTTTQTLNVTVSSGGSVTSSPSGINCPNSCSADFERGDAVTLTATPDSGGTFIEWDGACSGSGSCVVTMDNDQSVSAVFSSDETPFTRTLSVSINGSGTVNSAPSGIECSSNCDADFVDGEQVNLGATPADGWSFSGWGGACTGNETCTVTMDEAVSVSATFSELVGTTTRTVSVMVEGNGSVTSTPAGIDCGSTCTATFGDEETVSLTAAPEAGWIFTGWGGVCAGTGDCALTVSGDLQVSANFADQNGDDCGDDKSSVCSIATSTTFSGQIGAAADTDFIRMETPSGTYTVVREDGTLADTRITIRSADDDDDFIAENGSDTLTNNVTFDAQTGISWIEIESRSGNNTGAYTISVFRDDGCGSDKTSTCEASLGDTFFGNIDQDQDIDFVQIPTTLGNSYELTLLDGTLTDTLAVIRNDNESNDFIAQNFDGGLLSSVSFTADGAVTWAQIYSLSGANTGSYSFFLRETEAALEDDCADDISSTCSVAVGSSFFGQIGSSQDSDYIRVATEAGQEYSASRIGGTLADALIVIRNSSGGFIAQNLDGDLNSTVNFEAQGTETWIQVSSLSRSNTGSYFVSVSTGQLPSDSDLPQPSEIVFDPSDTPNPSDTPAQPSEGIPSTPEPDPDPDPSQPSDIDPPAGEPDNPQEPDPVVPTPSDTPAPTPTPDPDPDPAQPS